MKVKYMMVLAYNPWKHRKPRVTHDIPSPSSPRAPTHSLFTSARCPTRVLKQCWVSRSHHFTRVSLALERRRKTQTWGKTPEVTIFLSGRNAKKSKTCQNASQSSCSSIEFCKPNKKGTAMLQVSSHWSWPANIWKCIKKWVSSTKPTKHYFFHLKKKKKQKQVLIILNWTDCMHFSIKLINSILKS